MFFMNFKCLLNDTFVQDSYKRSFELAMLVKQSGKLYTPSSQLKKNWVLILEENNNPGRKGRNLSGFFFFFFHQVAKQKDLKALTTIVLRIYQHFVRTIQSLKRINLDGHAPHCLILCQFFEIYCAEIKLLILITIYLLHCFILANQLQQGKEKYHQA